MPFGTNNILKKMDLLTFTSFKTGWSLEIGNVLISFHFRLSLEEAAKGFSRDAFGRQSMSEKRHATLDAKNTDTYQRNKKLREEREKGKWNDSSGSNHRKKLMMQEFIFHFHDGITVLSDADHFHPIKVILLFSALSMFLLNANIFTNLLLCIAAFIPYLIKNSALLVKKSCQRVKYQ